ncbi:MAG: tetratricopeptide repeat protein [Chthoniobacteraceae bacterium]
MQATTARAQSKEITLTGSPEAVMHFREGWEATGGNDAEAALYHLKIAMDKDPNFGLARAMYVSQRGGTPATLEADLAKAVTDASKGGPAELVLAMAFREAGLNHQTGASTLFRAASELAPSDPFVAAAALRLANNDPKMAYQSAKEFAVRYPDYAPVYNTLAYRAWAAGDHAAALDAALKQVQLTPKNPNSHDSYAEMMQWSGKLPDALMHYQEAVTMSPAFTEGYIGMAEVEALQGHYDKARAHVQQAIAHTTRPAQKLTYMRDIAGIYTIAGDSKSTVTQLLAVASEAKAQGNLRAAAVSYSQIAATAGVAGDAKAAHSYLDMAHATYADPSAVVNYYAAMAHGRLKHWEPAIAAIAAARTAPDLANLGGRLAGAESFLAASQGKAADAVSLLSAADPTDPVIALRLAEAYAASGRAADATRLQQQISNDNALDLADWPGANSRFRARMAMGTPAKRKK